MDKGKIAAIIGGVIAAVFLLLIVGYSQSQYDDARLADLRATYFDDVDRLAVAVVLTDSYGEFTEANGHIEITITKTSPPFNVISKEYDFTKGDFLTWNNLFLGKERGVVFTIDDWFGYGEYDVYANLQTKSSYWEGLHATFDSFETLATKPQQSNCDPSYPDFCIPSPPPDLDCSDILQKRFTVYAPDPHRFDGNKDGIGC